MDEVIRSKFHFQEHTGILTKEMTQPTEDIILERNAELRKNPGALRDLGEGSEGGSWGRQIASIPEVMFEAALRNGFALNDPDSNIAGMEMHRYLQTEEGLKCLVQ